MAGYSHDVSSMLVKIDDVHYKFLRELEVCPVQAFREFAFAPPSLRRHVGLLGLLHKRVIGKCHPTFERLLPWLSDRFPDMLVRGHNKQLYGHWSDVTAHRALFDRSIFAMCDIYNNLPQEVVNAKSVHEFQKRLMQIVHSRCQHGDPDWASSFCRRDGPDTRLN